MVVAFNILKIWFDEFSIIMFWVIPAFLGTFQLFFFGTYLPHKYPHTKNRQPYKARTQKKKPFFGNDFVLFFWIPLRTSRFTQNTLVEIIQIKR